MEAKFKLLEEIHKSVKMNINRYQTPNKLLNKIHYGQIILETIHQHTINKEDHYFKSIYHKMSQTLI